MAANIPSPIGPNQRLPEYATRVVARRAERLAFLAERASRITSEDNVHKLRVAARRLGSALDALTDHFPANGATKVSKQAKHLRSAAGSVRDHDIALTLAAEVGLQLSDKARERIERKRHATSEGLRGQLASLRGKSPGAEWAHALRLAGRSRACTTKTTAASYAGALLPRMANEFFESGHEAVAPAATIESLHAFRILGKRFRYTLEIFAPCYSDGLQDALQLLRGIQDILGLINDCETASKILADAVNRNQREQVKALLIQRQAALIESFRNHWNETFAAEGECVAWMQMLAKPAFAPASETGDASDQQAAAC